jgi:hypothetical protein
MNTIVFLLPCSKRKKRLQVVRCTERELLQILINKKLALLLLHIKLFSFHFLGLNGERS